MAGRRGAGHDVLSQPGLHAAGPVPSHLFDCTELQPVGFPRRGRANLPLLISGPRMRWTRSLPLLIAAVSLGAGPALFASARADTVGTAGAVNTSSSGTLPAGPTRLIEI